MTGRTKYQYYANGITALHFLWTFIIFGGAALMFFWHPYAIMEVVVVSFTLLIALPFGAVCPLTLLEERLRQKHDPSYRNNGSYLAVYINKIFKARFAVRTVNATIGVLYVAIYASAFFLILQAH